MAGLDPAIYVDPRVKPGDDDYDDDPYTPICVAKSSKPSAT